MSYNRPDMLDCRRCRNWVDESFAELYEESQNGHGSESVFYGCKIFGILAEFERQECAHYAESSELFAVCSSCGIATPKVCLSLGECVNCTNTDLYCVENCRGEEEKKFCSHFQRLALEGHTLIENNKCFDIYPSQEAPAKKESEAPPMLSLFSTQRQEPE